MVKWNDEMEKKFLMAIIHDLGAPTPNFDRIAALMGKPFTVEGLKTKYYKGIKKQAYASFGGDEGGGGLAKTFSKRDGKKAVKSGSSKRKATKDVEEDDDGDDEEASPSKKAKVKQEVAEESDEEFV